MGRVLAKSEPLGEKELSFLRAHILKQRRKTQKVEVRKLVAFTKERKDHDKVLSDATRESCNKEDTPEHIGKQLEALYSKLESMKEEKHRLFQELKKVLHEEDEKKRQKDLIHREVVCGEGDIRQNLAQHGPPGSISQKPHRGPLLPNPDTGPVYMRSGSGLCHVGPYGAPASHFQRQGFPDVRFVQPHVSDMPMQGAQTTGSYFGAGSLQVCSHYGLALSPAAVTVSANSQFSAVNFQPSHISDLRGQPYPPDVHCHVKQFSESDMQGYFGPTQTEYQQSSSHLQDPRHRVLSSSGSNLNSPVSLQSPSYSNKQEGGAHESPLQSPAFIPSTHERKRR